MKTLCEKVTLMIVASCFCVAGQTTIDMSKQGKLEAGTVLPSQCTTGQMFLKTGGPSGATLHACSNNVWTAVGPGSGDALCTVAPSSTPVFDASQCSTFSLMLSDTAVTSSSLVNAKAGQALTFIVTQDGAGGRPFVWPPNLARPCPVTGSSGVSSIVTAIYDGSNASTTYCTTTEDATLVTGPTRGAPGTPASGLSCWFDTAGTWKCLDTAGLVHAAVLTAPGPTPQQFVTYIDGDGVAHTAAVSASQLSDGTTGSGAVVLAANPTIGTPAIASFQNAQHTHLDAAGGGKLTEQALNLSNVTTGDASTSQHGFMPKLPGDSSKCLLGDGTYGSCPSAVTSVQGTTGAVTVTDVNLSTSDVTTNNASTSKHGFMPKLPGDSSKCLLGDGTYGSCPSAVTSVQGTTGAVTVTDANLSTSDVATNNASTSKHGFMPKLPGDSSKCLLGDGTYGPCGSAVTEQGLSLSDVTTDDATVSRHGFLPKLPGDVNKCLLGNGTYGSCGGGSGSGFTMSGLGNYALFSGEFTIKTYSSSSPMPGGTTWACDQTALPFSLKVQNYFTVSGGGGTASDVFVAAWFTDSGSNTVGSKISGTDMVAVGNNSTSYKQGAWGSAHPILSPGVYWVCYGLSAGNWTTNGTNFNGAAGQISGAPRRVVCGNSVTYSGASTTLPTSCTSPAAGTANLSAPYLVVTQ